MKVKVLMTGKSGVGAEGMIQEALDTLNIAELISVSDSGLRVILVYEEKKVAKDLTKNDDIVSIRERKGNQEESSHGNKNTTDKPRGSKPPKKTRTGGKPKE